MQNNSDISPIITDGKQAGFLTPIIGRKALRDVTGFPGFMLIREGETVTRDIADTAQAMGKLYELTAATSFE